MICLKCNAFHPGFIGRLCPICSEPLQLETAVNRDRLVLGRLREYLSVWKKSGRVSSKTVGEIEAALSNTNLLAEDKQESPAFGFLSLFLDWFQNLITVFFAGVGAIFEPMIVKPNSNRYRGKRSGKEADASYESLTEGILADDNSGSSRISGLDALSELDEKPRRKKGKQSREQFKSKPKEPEFEIWAGLRPLFNEYIWWFIGSLLVLTGSIMGIREAWLVLTGISRHLTVLGAVFLYQALFTALGIFLGTKSVLTGRLLSGISLLLLPVSFSVASDVIVANSILGFVTLGILVGLTYGILNAISRQFQIEANQFILPILPSVIILALIPFFGSEIPSIVLSFFPFVLINQMGRNVTADKLGSKGLFLLSIYGALAVLVVFLNQALEGNTRFSLGTLAMGVFLLWVLVLSAILVITFGMLSIRGETRRLYVVLEILFLAVTLVIASTTGLFIYTTSPEGFSSDFTRMLYLGMPILVSVLFFDTIMRHEEAIHPFMVLSIFSSFILTREFLPSTNWTFALASFVPVSGMLFYKNQSSRMQNTLFGWGTLVGILTCLVLINFDLFSGLQNARGILFFLEPSRLSTIIPILACGLYFGGVSHRVGGWSRSVIHLPASFGFFTVLHAFALYFLPEADSVSRLGIVLGALCVVYHFVAIEFERRCSSSANATKAANSRNETDDSLFRPMDDISLLAGVLSFFYILFVSRAGSSENGLVLLTGAILLFRSFRDRSSFSSFLGALLISLAIFRLTLNSFTLPSTATNAFASSIIALGSGILCILFPNFSPAPVQARKVFFMIRLPFPAQGPVLIRNALSATSILYIIYSVSLIFFWLGLDGQPERNLVILSGILLTLTFSVAFFTRAFNSLYLRGSTVSLALIFVSIGLAAVANRIGRPLPPTVVGLNLTLGIIGLWAFSRLLFHKGQILADWLENSPHGKFYHHVPLSAMLLLGIVLLLDVFLLQPNSIARFLYIIPPTFFVGAGLAALFYSRSIQSLIPLQVALGLFVFASMLGFAQGSFLGTSLIALDPPGGRWVPSLTENATRLGDWLDPAIFLPPGLNRTMLIMRAAAGIATAGSFYALCVLLLPLTALGAAIRKVIFRMEDFLPLQFLFSTWSIVCTGLLAIIAFQYAFITPGVITLIGGGFLILARYSKEGNISIALSGLFILHGLAHQNPNYPFWAGPAFALIGLLMIFSVKPLSSFSKKPYSRILESSHAGAFLYSSAGFIYALATLSQTMADNAVPGLLTGAGFGLGGLWMLTLALGITSGISALSLFIGAFQWTKILSTAGASLSMLLLAFAGVTTFPVLCQYGICTTANTIQVLPEMMPYFALIISAVASFAYFYSVFIKEKREDVSLGAGAGSDILIVVTGILLAIFIRLGIPSSLLFNNLVLIASIGLVIFISVIASIQARQSRHIYFTQTSIASLYLALKQAYPEILTPEVDAIAALVFGFILTGVTTVAHRAGIPPLEESTRRFASLMPVVAAVVLPTEPSYQNAGMATFSAALYAGLAIASSNRVYAVLAAVAANLAIFTAIMASEVQGIEIYLAPLGLFSLFLGHIFRENLTDQARKIIRVGGGLLLYLPAAVNISFEMGRAQDAMYAVVFGLLCLAGIAAGMIFQIRSYLFMGVSFFTLNLVANLLQKGLRDQRMGFILLSLAGISIIGSLVYYTLKKDQILGYVERVQKRLAKWD